MTQTAAIVYSLIIAGVIVFQFCLIAGAPWGHLTQGGRNEGALPVAGRTAAAVSALLLAAMAGAMMSAASLVPNWPIWTAYIALAIQLLSTLMNLITPSRAERLLWGPITVVMLALASFVVISS